MKNSSRPYRRAKLMGDSSRHERDNVIQLAYRVHQSGTAHHEEDHRDSHRHPSGPGSGSPEKPNGGCHKEQSHDGMDQTRTCKLCREELG